MKDLLSKDYYCYKINTLLVKGMTYPFLVYTTLLSGLSHIFYKKNWTTPHL